MASRLACMTIRTAAVARPLLRSTPRRDYHATSSAEGSRAGNKDWPWIVRSTVCTELHVDEHLPHVVRICCCFRPHRKFRVTPVDADALEYKYPVTLMVILCVSSSRLTTSLVKLHANMARILPTRPTRRGIHSKNSKRTLLCVSSHLERLRGTEMLMGRPLIVQNPAPWPQNRQKVDGVESVNTYTVRFHSSPIDLIPLSCAPNSATVQLDECNTDSGSLSRRQTLQKR